MLFGLFVLILASVVLAGFEILPIPMAFNSSPRSTRFAVLQKFQNKSVTSSCFTNYMDIEVQLAIDYNTTYSTCMLKAIALHNKTNALMDLPHQRRADAISTRINACKEFNTTIEILKCHAALATNIFEETFEISKSAADLVRFLQDEHTKIDFEVKHCCNEAEIGFHKKSVANRANLQKCLDGFEGPKYGPVTKEINTTTANDTPKTDVKVSADVKPLVKNDTPAAESKIPAENKPLVKTSPVKVDEPKGESKIPVAAKSTVDTTTPTAEAKIAADAKPAVKVDEPKAALPLDIKPLANTTTAETTTPAAAKTTEKAGETTAAPKPIDTPIPPVTTAEPKISPKTEAPKTELTPAGATTGIPKTEAKLP